MVSATTSQTNGVNASELPVPEPIAIIGAACRLPGEASSLHRLWNMMQNSRSAHAKVPKARWDADAWYHPDPDRKGALTSTHGFFLEQDIAAFDAPFFSVTAKEAAGMDPAKRLLLEVSYEAFENAGIPIDDVAGSQTGVYVGSMTSDYEVLSTREIYDEPHMAAAGSSEAMTANRVSWFFDLRGPSLTLDTACSSSLYALHLACQSLRLRETNLSLVAGVNVILHPNFMQQLTAMHMLSPDGISHTFDDRANGYGRGEGIGGIVVKRLADAIRDGDTIRAVIRGSGVNVDGKTPSVTMPSSEAQAALIRDVYAEARLPLDKTEYIELHGTGTPVGDPIELTAIAATFGAVASPEKPIYVGSIKPNVGHTEGCAGLAGVFKAMMSLEKGVILPTAEVENVNPKLRFADWNLALPQGAIPWPSNGPRRISVNSFGFGGANAHVILDDAYHYMKEHGLNGKHSTTLSLPPSPPPSAAVETKQQQKLFVLSSRDEPGIKRLAKSLEVYWKAEDGFDTAEYSSSVAYTLASRRTLFDYRSFAVADSISGLAQQLERSLPRFKRSSKQNGLAFVFTGQGAQWAGMGRQLIDFPVFAASIARSKACLESLSCPFDVEFELENIANSKIESSEYSQPICTVVQVALVDLLADWGIRPKAVVGHSSGEIAAAYAAEILTHEDAIKVAYLRGVYSGVASRGPKRGGMMAAGISEEEAQAYLATVPQESVVVACVNSPKSVTLSGDADYVDQLEKTISQDGKFARKLRVVTAYHSPHMRLVGDDCLKAMVDAGVGEPRLSKTPMFSSVTGKLIDPAEVGREYWIRNMCGTVRFSPAVQQLLTYSPGRRAARKTTVNWTGILEVGPHSALKAPLVQIMEGVDAKLPTELPYASMLVRKEDAITTALKAAGQLWALGVPIPLEKVNREAGAATQPQVVVDLPSYPWNHEKQYWHETAATKEQRLQSKTRTDLLGIAVENQNPFEPQWRNFLRVRENPWVEDHKITGTTLYPGAGMLIMVIEAVNELAAGDASVKGVEFKDVHFERGLVIPGEGATETLLRIQTPGKGDSSLHTFAVYSRIGENSWTKHCFGSFSIIREEGSEERELATFEWSKYRDEFASIKDLPSKDVDVARLYKNLYEVGMQYGPTFQNLKALIASSDHSACHGTVAIPDTKSVMPSEYEFPHLIHPATLDAIFHLIVVAVAGGTTLTEAAVPYLLEKLFISFDLPKGAGSLFSGFSKRVDRKDKQLAADLIVSDEAWTEPKIIVKGLIMREVSSGASKAAVAKQLKTTRITWKADPESIARSHGGFEVTRLGDWLELESHKSSDLSVLVIGNTLEASSVTDELKPFITGATPYRGFSRLTVIDTSEEALEQWKKLPTSTSTSTNFAVWDGSSDLDESTFDLVISGRGSEPAWPRWQSLVRPDGRLLVLDPKPTHQNGVSNGAQGHQVLSLGNGAKLDVYFHDKSAEDQERPKEVALLLPSVSNDISTALESVVRATLSQRGVSVRAVALSDALNLKGEHVISLLGDSFINNWSPEEFTSFQDLIATAAHVFFITRGGQMLAPSEVGLQSASVPGLLRVLRNEFPQIALAHLDLSPSFDAADSGSGDIVIDAWASTLGQDKDLELAEVNGHIFLPRSVADPLMDTELALATGSEKPSPKSLSAAGPLRLSQDAGVAWEADEEAGSPLGADEVELDVLDVSVDLAASASSARELLGNQVVGRVVRSGSNAFVPGDRVVAVGASGFKTHIRQHAALVRKLPEDVPADGAAAKVWLLATALYALKHVVSLSSGQSLLIQGGATSLGQALIHTARQFSGVNVFTTVAIQEQKALLVEKFGFAPESIAIISHAQDGSRLAAYLLDKTNGQGVDAIVSSGPATIDVVGDLVPSLSDFARVAVIGQASQALLSGRLPGNVSFSTIDPQQILLSKPRLAAKLLSEISDGVLPEIVPSTRFSVTDLSDALAHADNADNSGIVSIQLQASDDVPVKPSPPPAAKLDPKATYILAGGLGSLGLRIADVLAQSGATHLVFLSRSGGGRYEDRLEALRRQGCEPLVVKCDVTSREDVRNAVVEAEKTGRPIKGLIQCAMVLQDSLFDQMTYKQWRTAFKPKVDGTWYLHELLPADMDFFVMLSSVVSVIGNVSQANYAAGNSYMDGLAHYRRSIGRAATSINAGLVADSDHTIDGTTMEDYLDRFKHMASVSTTLGELDTAILASVRGAAADGQQLHPQFVYCMTDSLQPEGVDFWARDKKFVHRTAVADASAAAIQSSGPSVAELLSAAASKQDATFIVQETLKKLLAPGLGIQPADIDDDRPLYDVGVDSFKAVEIRNQVFRELKSDISVFEILSPSSLAQLSGTIVSRSQLVPAQVKEMNEA